VTVDAVDICDLAPVCRIVNARKWFKDEIGVTFTEQTRNMTAYVIRKPR